MNGKLFLKPKKGLKVQKYIGDLGRIEYISENGERLPNTLYYRRLVKRGELVTATEKAVEVAEESVDKTEKSVKQTKKSTSKSEE